MKNTEVLMPRESKAEAESVLIALSGMTEQEQREMLVFLKGVELGRQMAAGAGPAAYGLDVGVLHLHEPCRGDRKRACRGHREDCACCRNYGGRFSRIDAGAGRVGLHQNQETRPGAAPSQSCRAAGSPLESTPPGNAAKPASRHCAGMKGRREVEV